MILQGTRHCSAVVRQCNETLRNIQEKVDHNCYHTVLEILMGYETLNLNTLNTYLKIRTERLSMEACAGYNWYFLTIETETKKLLNATDFLLQLKDHASHLVDLLSAIDRLFTGHFASIRIDNVQHRLSCSNMLLEMSADRDVKRRRYDNNCVLFRCKIIQEDSTMLRECCYVSKYLHRLKLVHPNMDIMLNVECPAIPTSAASLRWTKSATGNCKSTTIDATAQHYTRNEDICRQPKIVTRSSQVSTMDLQDLPEVRVNIRAVSAVVSGLGVPWHGIDKCKEVKVFLCGPNGLPMVLSYDGACAYHLENIIPLVAFNMTIGKEITESSIDSFLSADEPACSDWHCELSDYCNPSTSCNDSTSTATSSDTSGGLLCIWLNVDLHSPKGTKQLLGVTRWLRENLPLFFTRYQSKFRDAVSTTLKSLNDYCTKEANKQKLLQSAVNTMTTAIGSIVSRSTNNEFRNRCFARSQTGDARELQLLVKDKLWQIAVSRHGVTRPADHSSSIRDAVRQSFRTAVQDKHHSAMVEQKGVRLRNSALSTPVTSELDDQMPSSLIAVKGKTASVRDVPVSGLNMQDAHLGHGSLGAVELPSSSCTVSLASHVEVSCSLLTYSKPTVDAACKELSAVENKDYVVCFSRKDKDVVKAVGTSNVDDQNSSNIDSDFAYLSQMHWNVVN